MENWFVAELCSLIAQGWTISRALNISAIPDGISQATDDWSISQS